MTNIELGRFGEDIVANYVVAVKKYKIISRNYRTKCGEIDIIAIDNGGLIFIEVKTRQKLKYGQPREAITANKIKHIVNTSLLYQQKYRYKYKFVRYDVAEVILNDNNMSLKYLENIRVDG